MCYFSSICSDTQMYPHLHRSVAKFWSMSKTLISVADCAYSYTVLPLRTLNVYSMYMAGIPALDEARALWGGLCWESRLYLWIGYHQHRASIVHHYSQIPASRNGRRGREEHTPSISGQCLEFAHIMRVDLFSFYWTISYTHTFILITSKMIISKSVP